MFHTLTLIVAATIIILVLGLERPRPLSHGAFDGLALPAALVVLRTARPQT